MLVLPRRRDSDAILLLLGTASSIEAIGGGVELWALPVLPAPPGEGLALGRSRRYSYTSAGEA